MNLKLRIARQSWIGADPAECPWPRLRRVAFLSLIVTAFFVMTGCQHAKQTPLSSTPEAALFEGWGFEMQVPRNLVVEPSAGTAFISYNVRERLTGRQFLLIYAGNFPRFPAVPQKKPKIHRDKINGMSAHFVVWKDAAGRHSKDMLIQLRPKTAATVPTAVPVFLHCAYMNLSEEDAAISDAILSSIRVTTQPQKELPAQK